MPKDRGAEQGDVDGPLECSLALGWLLQKHGCAVPRNEPPGLLSLGLERTTHCTRST